MAVWWLFAGWSTWSVFGKWTGAAGDHATAGHGSFVDLGCVEAPPGCARFSAWRASGIGLRSTRASARLDEWCSCSQVCAQGGSRRRGWCFRHASDGYRTRWSRRPWLVLTPRCFADHAVIARCFAGHRSAKHRATHSRSTCRHLPNHAVRFAVLPWLGRALYLHVFQELCTVVAVCTHHCTVTLPVVRRAGDAGSGGPRRAVGSAWVPAGWLVAFDWRGAGDGVELDGRRAVRGWLVVSTYRDGRW